ncbi:type VI secretion system baseplate subunit TssF [Serratia sp. AKBS12]|uniref:type VI secretion system baseplate subunit TssF n=1 Tax=Serratia sp. AKBS12 TaxID=2974597 RepID=UPI00216603E7|nr:type VI secretion system baseplate subunit TssF [Serratia sp. AKBS12]MCS3408363.1 type VI secretion system baseplate subunit TssF [Serratia sp. AKBS12]HEI8864701.1 type VI secretion system baseplate subunit TssF [Serratia odorifera]
MLSERFLGLYNEELRYLRESGQQFAERHPQVAQHLGMHTEGIQDPFVERLLEGTAFLSARVHERIDNEYPEFALQMLSRLAPLWYTPMPSIATVVFEPDFTSPLWQAPVALPKGSRISLSDASLKNKAATFITGRELHMEPIDICTAECSGSIAADLPASVAACLHGTQSCIRLRLTTRGIKPLSAVNFNPLHLTFAGDAGRANQLLLMLLNHCRRVVLWARQQPVPLVRSLGSESLRLSGVAEDEALLPSCIGELPGSRLMREYFAAPSRFYAVELHGLNDFLAHCGELHEFEIIFALDSVPSQLIGRVTAQDFCLFATPVVNLFPRRCDPQALNADRTEHQVVVDRLNPTLYEIHHLQTVQGMLRDGGNVRFSMLPEEAQFDRKQPQAGYALRRQALAGGRNRQRSVFGDDALFITLSPGASGIALDDVIALSVVAMVSDGQLRPEHLQQPTLQTGIALPMRQTTLLRMPSSPRPVPDMRQAWQAVQLMAVNPLRYAKPDVNDCAALLRQWLSLFSWQEDASQRKRIASLAEATFSHSFEQHQGPGPIAWNRGMKACLNIHADHHADQGGFLFGLLLHYALSEYCQLNQTLRTTLHMDTQPVAEWGPVDGL